MVPEATRRGASQGFDPPDQIAVSGPHLATRVVGTGERLEFAVEVGTAGRSRRR
jgi:hypothetical protein